MQCVQISKKLAIKVRLSHDLSYCPRFRLTWTTWRCKSSNTFTLPTPAGPLALHGHAFKLNISDKQNSLKVQLENRK